MKKADRQTCSVMPWRPIIACQARKKKKRIARPSRMCGKCTPSSVFGAERIQNKRLDLARELDTNILGPFLCCGRVGGEDGNTVFCFVQMRRCSRTRAATACQLNTRCDDGNKSLISFSHVTSHREHSRRHTTSRACSVVE